MSIRLRKAQFLSLSLALLLALLAPFRVFAVSDQDPKKNPSSRGERKEERARGLIGPGAPAGLVSGILSLPKLLKFIHASYLGTEREVIFHQRDLKNGKFQKMLKARQSFMSLYPHALAGIYELYELPANAFTSQLSWLQVLDDSFHDYDYYYTCEDLDNFPAQIMQMPFRVMASLVSPKLNREVGRIAQNIASYFKGYETYLDRRKERGLAAPKIKP